MMQRIQRLNQGQRILIFIFIFGGGLLLLIALVVGLVLLTVNTAPRPVGQAVDETVVVEEFMNLPGNDAYPATITAHEGVLYTGSYGTGAIWSITQDGVIDELADTREQFGSVAALAFNAEGTMYVLDRIDPDIRAAGGLIYAISPDGAITEFGIIPEDPGFVSAHDLTVDSAGNVYVSDRGRRDVWRFTPDGEGELWWTVPEDDTRRNDVIPAGLDYDAPTDTILLTDAGADTLYRITIDGEMSEIIYRYPEDAPEDERPVLYGVSIAPDGEIYLAAFRPDESNGVLRLVTTDDANDIEYVANNFRGSSDVLFLDERVYVTNFDSQSLVLPGVDPQVPFTIDVVILDAITPVEDSE